jgi:hypothetical protein
MMDRADRLNALAVEYENWLKDNGWDTYPGDARELLADLGYDAGGHHRQWLNDFIQRWDEVESTL